MFDEKTRQVLAAQAAKTTALAASRNPAQQAAADYAGANNAVRSIRDEHYLQDAQGHTVGDRVVAMNTHEMNANRSLTTAEHITNAPLGVIQGLGNGLIGVGSVLNAVVGSPVNVAGIADTWNQALGESQGQRVQDRMNAHNAQQAELYAQNRRRAQEQVDSAEMSAFDAGFDRVVNDIGTGLSGAVSSPLSFSQGASNVGGSFLAGGAVTKGLSALGASTKVAGMLGMGSMELGGAINQAGSSVNEMSHDQLMAGSDTYRNYILKNGDTEATREAGKRELRVQTERDAALIMAPVAAIGGAVTGRIPAGIARPGANLNKPVTEALRDMGTEAIEEMAMEASGNLASNAAVKFSADREQDILEGVGQGIAEGGLFGGFSASPRVGAAIITQAADGIAGRYNEAKSRIQAASSKVDPTVTSEDANVAVKAATQSLNEVDPVQVARDAASSSSEIPNEFKDVPTFEEELQQFGDRYQAVAQTFAFDFEGFDPQNQAEVDLLNGFAEGESVDMFDVMQSAADRIMSDATSSEDRANLAALVADLQDSVADGSLAALEKLAEEVHPKGKLAQDIERIQTARTAVVRAREINSAIEQGVTGVVVKAADVADINTSEGLTAARILSAQMSIDPMSVDLDAVDVVLKQSRKAKGENARRLMDRLAMGAAVSRTVQRYQVEAERLGIQLPAMSRVAKEIQSLSYDAKAQTGPSLRAHIGQVLGSVGDNDAAKNALMEFQAFAQHMANKLGAINESFASRVGRKNSPANFQAYNAATGAWFTQKPLVVLGQQAASIAYAQQVGLDAMIAVEVFNAVIQEFPELGVEPVQRDDLHPYLVEGSAAEVAEATKKRDRDPNASYDVTTVHETSPNLTSVEDKTKADEVSDSEKKEDSAKKVETEIKSEIVAKEEEQSSKETVSNEKVSQKEELSPEEAARLDDRIEEYENEVKAQKAIEESVEIESVKTEPRSFANVFPNLVKQDDGVNLLSDSMELSREDRTNFAGEDGLGIGGVAQLLSDKEAFRAKFGEDLTYPELPVRQAYSTLLAKVLVDVSHQVQKRMLSSKAMGKIWSGAEAPNQLIMLNRRLLAFAVPNTTGKGLKFDETFYGAAQLALVDWLAQHTVAPKPVSSTKLARRLGIRETDVTEKMLEQYNSSTPEQQALVELADRIQKFTGVTAKKTAFNGRIEGAFMSLANEMLDAAVDVGLVTRTPVQFTERGNQGLNSTQTKTRMFVSVSMDGLGIAVKAKADGVGFHGNTTLISDMGGKHVSRKGYSVMKPEGEASHRQLRSMAKLTKSNQEVQLRENAVPHRANSSFITVLDHLGKDNLVRLFAAGNLTGLRMNVNDRMSKEGKNLAIISAYDSLSATVQEMAAVSDEQNIPLNDVSIYREYEFSSVARLQQQGSFGDQASKLVRDAITPYEATINLLSSKDDGKEMWYRGLGQALGVKIERLSYTEMSKQLNKKLKNKLFRKAVDALTSVAILHSDAVSDLDLVNALEAAGLTSPAQIHAALSYAQYLYAYKNDRKSLRDFKTHMYVEADGVTDGPTNSLMYMRIGGFDVGFIKSLRRGGAVFSKRPIPLHEIYSPEGGELLKDTYQHLADQVESAADASASSMVRTAQDGAGPMLQGLHTATFRVMRRLLGGAGFTYSVGSDGEITVEIGRNQLKNPVTVTVYGSSVGGIADKIAREIATQLYSRMSDAMQEADALGLPNQSWKDLMFIREVEVGADVIKSQEVFEEFFNDLETLAALKPKLKYEGKIPLGHGIDVRKAKTNYKLVNPERFTIDSTDLQNISDNIKEFYAAPIAEVINNELGSAVDGSKIIQQATHTLSAIARAAFTAGIRREMDKHIANKGSRSDGVTYEALQKVLNKVAWLLPYMEGDDIEVMIKGLTKEAMPVRPDPKAKNPLQSRFVATSEGERSNTNIQIEMPSLAGVAGAAFVNISYGDGRMIIKASPNLVGGRLMVFDGIHLALDSARINGLAINKAVVEAWETGTPFNDLLKIFQEVVDTFDNSSFDAMENGQLATDLGIALKNEQNYDIKSDLNGHLDTMYRHVQNAAMEETARKTVLSKVHISSDHMAALAAPYSTADQDRIDLSHLSDEEQARVLDEMFHEEMAKLKKIAKELNDTKVVEALAVHKALNEHLEFVDGVATIGAHRLRKLLEGNDLPSAHRAIARRALQSLNGQEWTVYFGESRKALNTFAAKSGIKARLDDADSGLTSMADKAILIANSHSETLVHELTHAATFNWMQQYFAEPSSVPTNVKEAIERLIALRSQWENEVEDHVSYRGKRYREAVRMARQGINEATSEAAKLNEFVAWNLASTDLSRLNTTMRVKDKITKITTAVRDALRKLFQLPPVRGDMFTNIRFNAMILMGDHGTAMAETAYEVLKQKNAYVVQNGENPALEGTIEAFAKLARNVDATWVRSQAKMRPSTLATTTAYRMANTVSQNGFSMTPIEKMAFVVVSVAFRLGLVDGKLMLAANKHYEDFLSQMTQANMMDDPDSVNPNDQNIASQRMKLLSGKINSSTDVKGRSMALPMFIALAASNPQFQEILSRMEVSKKNTPIKGYSLDKGVAAIGTRIMDAMVDKSLGIKAGKSIDAEMAGLLNNFVEQINREKTVAQEALAQASGLVARTNEFISDKAADALTATNDLLDKLVDEAQGTKLETFATVTLKATQMGMNVFNKRLVGKNSEKFELILNGEKLPIELRAAASELMGQNDGNTDVLSLTKIAKAGIDRVRQAYRKRLPEELIKRFNTAPTERQWDAMWKAGRFDIGSLFEAKMSLSDIMRALQDDKYRQMQIKRLEKVVQAKVSSSRNNVINDVNLLVDYLVTGRRDNPMMHLNAVAIANQLNLGNATIRHDTNSVLVREIDALTTLKALAHPKNPETAILQELAENESEGLATVVSMIGNVRAAEMSKMDRKAMLNVEKGWMPHEKIGQVRMVPANQADSLALMGWKVIGTRKAGDVERSVSGKASEFVYMSTDLEQPLFKQGILHTARQTSFGRDRVTGTNFDAVTGGLITGNAVKTITARLIRTRGKASGDELLQPLYNEDGNIYAYERLAEDSIVTPALKRQYNAATAISQWMGRQHEEIQAEAINSVLIDRLVDDYNSRTPEDFFDIEKEAEKNPVIADALALIPQDLLEEIRGRMGGIFYVRKTLMQNVIGYRNMTIGDIWTGNTTLSEEARVNMAAALTTILGDQAYARLSRLERGWENLMGDARVAIVVKSMIVPAINAASMYLQLMANGIGPVAIAQGLSRKMREAHIYSKNEIEAQSLLVQRAEAAGNKRPDLVANIDLQIKRLEDANKRLTIWPLIDAGHFGLITEGLTSDDLALTQGRIWDYVSDKANALPKSVKDAGRYALITKDTALFQGLAKAVSMTDLLGKAVLYDHLTQFKKMEPKKAMVRVNAEFGDFDYIPGRGRAKAESAGLVWFWAFKLRTMKVAAALIRENPLYVFLNQFMPGYDAFGSAVSDNMGALILDGRWDNSIGVDNALRGIYLHPMAQMAS